MKSNTILVLACLFSMPTFAQTLPDEINYAPYEARYGNLVRETKSQEAVLLGSRQSLADTQRFIREMTTHIVGLRGQIDSHQREIFRLSNEIPQLDREIRQLQDEDRRLMIEVRNRQSQENSLISRQQMALRDLRPMENNLAQKQRKVRELEQVVQGLKQEEHEVANRLAQARAQAEKLDKQVLETTNQIRQMQDELRNLEARLATLQSQLATSESAAASLRSQIQAERSQISQLEARVREAEAELARLRSSGAAPAAIGEAQKRVIQARASLTQAQNGVRQREGELARQEKQVVNLRSQLDVHRRNQAALPGKISQAEATLRQLQSQRPQLQSQINQATAELDGVRRQLDVRNRELAPYLNELRVVEERVMRQRQLINSMGRDIEALRAEIISLNQRSRHLNAEMMRLSGIARSHQQRIPRLEQEIRSLEGEIVQNERELAEAYIDERQLTEQVARDEAKLQDLVSRRDSAEREMRQRLGLYQHYLSEAQGLGSGQAQTALGLGDKEGERLSSVLSKQNGMAMGRELGVAEAKLWGSVRGEIEGYEVGHHEGLRSSEDINRATSEATIRAGRDAELYAQKHFKPVFFEEFVQEEFKKPLLQKGVQLKSLSRLSQVQALEMNRSGVAPLTEEEILRSQELATPLDAFIVEQEKAVIASEEKARRLSNPQVAFEVPTKIPYGQVNCSQVYKGIAVFKAACDSSYKENFASNFIGAARESFEATYTANYQGVFDSYNLSAREVSYPNEFAEAQKIGKAEGLRVGKIEIYQDTFESVYRSVYAVELEKSRAKAKVDAGLELVGFLKTNPLLTLAKTELRAENFRGGEEIQFLSKVKNVGQVGLNGPVIVRITEVVNAEKIASEGVLSSALPLAVTDLPALKVRALARAKAGDKVVIKGVVELPGDLYKNARTETFEITQVLAANPAHELSLEFNSTPNVKGPFRRYIHFLSAKISPSVEEIKDGYKVTLNAVGESASLVDLKETSFETGALAQGVSKEAKFSYVFKDAAKGREVAMELAVSYQGKIIKKEMITIRPK